VCQILAECEERGYASKITTNGGVPVHLRVNIDSSNVDSLPQLFQFIQAKGWIDTGNLLPYLAPLQLKEGCYEGEDSLDILLNRVFEIYRKHKETEIFDAFEFQPVFLIKQFFKSGGILPMQFKQCGANHGQYLLDLYGDISLCLGACGAKEYAVGSFYPKLYIDEEKLAAWRNRSMLTIPKCKECKFGPICGGGCSLKALENTGTLAAPHCPPIESMMRLALEYYFPVLRAMAVVH
jgi:uncharacterized protein